MEEILRRFPLAGRPVRIEPITAGHINRSFLVACEGGSRYVLQRINPHVFADAAAIMENLRLIRNWLKQSPEPPPIVAFIDTREGEAYYRDAEGAVWRLCPYAENTLNLLRPESESDFAESARAFGRFQYALRDFPAARLTETIPRFHDTPDRFRQLREAAEADTRGRKSVVGELLAFTFERETAAGVLQRERETEKLPLRVTHNDTKMSNVLLDADTRRARFVIDLDTVMPGLAAYDFGDAIRAGASTGAEDGTGIRLDLGYYEAFARAFLESCPHLSRAERESLPLGAWTMTLECGVRFLTDYLRGDVYFATAYPGQNLARAKAQFALAADMERRWDAMRQIIE